MIGLRQEIEKNKHAAMSTLAWHGSSLDRT
jgi:hypothetical protein